MVISVALEPPADGGQLNVLEHARRYVLLAGDRDVVRIPLLSCAATGADGLTANAEVSRSLTRSSSVKFSLLGTGMTMAGSLTLTTTDALTVSAGQRKYLYAEVPVLWEQRANPANEDDNWVVVEPDWTQTPGIGFADGEPPTTVDATEHIRFTGQTGEPQTVERRREIESTLAFSVGLDLKAINLKAELEIKADDARSVRLTVTVPAGADYIVSWLSAVDGVHIEAQP